MSMLIMYSQYQHYYNFELELCAMLYRLHADLHFFDVQMFREIYFYQDGRIK